MTPQQMQFPVDGGSLAALRWGPDQPRVTVLALHGITASSMAWPGVAAALPDDVALVAPDLRGRGHSRDLPGPWGLDQHVADVAAIAGSLDGDLVLAGHSMGAYIAVLAAQEHPSLFDRIVLIDGGLPLAIPPGADPDAVLAATLGPALERLRQSYPSEDAYVDFFRAHPALGPHWNDAVEDYVRYDALPTDEGVRSRAVEDAVRADGRDLITGVPASTRPCAPSPAPRICWSRRAACSANRPASSRPPPSRSTAPPSTPSPPRPCPT